MKISSLIILVSLGLFSCADEKSMQQDREQKNTALVESVSIVETNDTQEQAFGESGLRTDTSKSTIDLARVLSGGPAKDGIPAINNPEFLSIENAKGEMDYLGEKDYGIAVQVGKESRYYPYAILVWHEIVNDTLGNQKFSVTFCPLCGSAVVYDRLISSGEVNFGVSGKLYESNMLMYDSDSESLWSQSIGEALIGEKLGEKLKILPAHLMTFAEYEEKFPNGEVLSDQTGHSRNYGYVPYGDYDTSEKLYFSVQNEDASFPKKEIFYIVPVGDSSIAFHLSDLRENGEASFTLGNQEFIAKYQDGLIEVFSSDKLFPGYYEMWFSWRTHNPENENIWKN